MTTRVRKGLGLIALAGLLLIGGLVVSGLLYQGGDTGKTLGLALWTLDALAIFVLFIWGLVLVTLGLLRDRPPAA